MGKLLALALVTTPCAVVLFQPALMAPRNDSETCAQLCIPRGAATCGIVFAPEFRKSFRPALSVDA
jgi:hypothetical protein